MKRVIATVAGGVVTLTVMESIVYPAIVLPVTETHVEETAFAGVGEDG